MKYIKIDKNGNIVAQLTSDIINHNKEFVEVKDFPEQGYNYKFVNGKIMKGNRIVTPSFTKIMGNSLENRIKLLEDRVLKLEQQSKNR